MKDKIKLSAIAKALANDEFIFFYQPIVSLLTGTICGAESLIRWKQPDGTIVPLIDRKDAGLNKVSWWANRCVQVQITDQYAF